jgi:hypothetical protein
MAMQGICRRDTLPALCNLGVIVLKKSGRSRIRSPKR